MKRKQFCILVILTVGLILAAPHSIATPTYTVQEIFLVTTIILELTQGVEVGNATGFFYQKDDTVYLVTARHVVCDRKPDSLLLKLHTDAKDASKSMGFLVDLYREGRPLWHGHPKYRPDRPTGLDVVVVELNQERLRKGKWVINSLSKSRFFPEEYVVLPGENVFIMGYPRRMSDEVHNLPLMRQAMVATAYGVPFNGSPCFLVDASVSKHLSAGMSGGPVLTQPKHTFPTAEGGLATFIGSPIFLLGVFSGYVYKDRSSGDTSLEYGVVWYASLIEEIIESATKKKESGCTN